jgi:hypothetical protein
MFTLKHSVELYVPSYTQEHEKIKKVLIDSTVETVGTVLSSIFGGATVSTGKGFYDNKLLKKVQLEEVKIVRSYASKIDGKAKKQVIAMAQKIKDSMTQEAVMLVIDNHAMFV